MEWIAFTSADPRLLGALAVAVLAVVLYFAVGYFRPAEAEAKPEPMAAEAEPEPNAEPEPDAEEELADPDPRDLMPESAAAAFSYLPPPLEASIARRELISDRMFARQASRNKGITPERRELQRGARRLRQLEGSLGDQFSSEEVGGMGPGLSEAVVRTAGATLSPGSFRPGAKKSAALGRGGSNLTAF